MLALSSLPVRSHIKALLDTCSRTCPRALLTSPTAPAAFRHLPPTVSVGTDRVANSSYARPQSNHGRPHPRLVCGLKHWDLGHLVRMDYKGQPDPVIRTASPAPLAQDFARQQVSKQQRSNYHSSSLASAIPRTMVSQSVNKTGLHPAGVQYVPAAIGAARRAWSALLTCPLQAVQQGPHRDRGGAPRSSTHRL